MRAIERLFSEYGESHQNATNKRIHWICVPLILWSIIALLWMLRWPGAESVWVNAAVGLLLVAQVYYFSLSMRMGFATLLLNGGLVLLSWQLHALLGAQLAWLALAIFVLAWIGQFVGHKIEGKKPSFFKDIQFLLIGPAWLLGFIFRRFGWHY
jgi:uncharacterized membrane protein YGL010W